MRDIRGIYKEKENVWRGAKQATIDKVRDAGQAGIDPVILMAQLEADFRFDREDTPENLIRVLEKENKIHYENDDRGCEVLRYGPRLGQIIIRSEKKGETDMSEKKDEANPIDWIKNELANGEMRSGDLVQKMNKEFKFVSDTMPYRYLKQLEKTNVIKYSAPAGDRNRKVFLTKNEGETMIEEKNDYSEVPSINGKTKLDEALEKTGFGITKPIVRQPSAEAIEANSRPEPKTEVKAVVEVPVAEPKVVEVPKPAEVKVDEIDEEHAALVDLTKLTVKGVLEAFDKEIEKHINAKLKAKMTMSMNLAGALGASNVKGAMSQRDALRKWLEAQQ